MTPNRPPWLVPMLGYDYILRWPADAAVEMTVFALVFMSVTRQQGEHIEVDL